jgi:hypothetical protein
MPIQPAGLHVVFTSQHVAVVVHLRLPPQIFSMWQAGRFKQHLRRATEPSRAQLLTL